MAMSSDEYDSEEEEEAWVETATCQLRSPVPETSLIGEAGGWLQSSLDWMLLAGPAHGAADAAGATSGGNRTCTCVTSIGCTCWWFWGGRGYACGGGGGG